MKQLISFFLFLPVFLSAQDSTGKWSIVPAKNEAMPRHENSFVECDGKLYSLGGRGKKPIEEFDPATGTWKTMAMPPVEFNHFQAISFQHEVYVIGALTGNYPHETPLPNFLIFNPKTNQWREGAVIPVNRRRGSAGVFSRGEKIYVVSGIQDGHWDGHVTWFDEYDTKTGQWKVLPDAPRPRDHFQAALMGEKLLLAGGRKSHGAIGKVLELTIGEVDQFDFTTGKWTTLPTLLPTPRGGTASIAKAPYLVVMNGESAKQVSSHSEVEALNIQTMEWTRLPDLQKGRHGTGAAYLKGKLYVAAGSANRGGGPELNDMECLEWK